VTISRLCINGPVIVEQGKSVLWVPRMLSRHAT
jgi:hypothetical protein